jgi:hypothetical protein
VLLQMGTNEAELDVDAVMAVRGAAPSPPHSLMPSSLQITPRAPFPRSAMARVDNHHS